MAADRVGMARFVPPVARHLLAYGLLLVGLVALLPSTGSFSSDAGAYGGQVYALRHGGWALDRPVTVVAEANEGWLNTAITPDGPTPYTANPGYALLLAGATAVVHGPGLGADGPVEAQAGDLGLGLRLVPMLSALAAAGAAWALARRLAPDHPPAAPLALWLLASGPVLVNATTLWAHTLSTALGGWGLVTLLALTEPHRGRRIRLASACGLALCLGLSAVVRTEAAFWVAAVVVTGMVRARTWPVRLLVGALAAPAAVLWLANRAWGSALRADRLPIETSVEALSGGPGWLAGRLPAAWLLLIDGGGDGATALLTAGAIAALAAAVLNVRREGQRGTRAQAVLIGAAAVLYALRLVVAPDSTISGLAGAWPLAVFLLLAGAGATTRSGSGPEPTLRWLLAPAGLLTVAVLATQYSGSGGLQWGGRYLSFALVPLAVAAVVRGRDLLERLRLPLLALALAPALCGMAATVTLHRHHAEAVQQASGGAPVVITESPALPRIAWPVLPVAFYRATPDDIGPLLDVLATAGVAEIDVHGLATAELDGAAGYEVVETDGPRRRLRLDPTATPSPGALAADP